jgi:1-acyl-sn-glycerol-3-phosphate acyltransferase
MTAMLHRETIPRFLCSLVKGLAAAFLIAAYIVHAHVILFIIRSRRRRLRLLMKNGSRYSRIALHVLNVRVRATRERELRERSRSNALVVANHVSWVDILILSSLRPSVFVTSVELKRTPLLGLLARISGCLFVERRSPSGLRREIGSLTGVLQDGVRVVLFPEGTTSDGETVRSFKGSLFDTAVRARVNVRPVCLRYRSVDGAQIDSHNRDRIYYYGGTRFFHHLLRVLALRSVEVDVAILRSLHPPDYPSRKELAARAHEVIANTYLAGDGQKDQHASKQ